jgi:cutinase
MTVHVAAGIPVIQLPDGDPVEAPCTEIQIIGVRGSTEPQSGSRLLTPVGDALAAALPGRVSYTELDYPATIRHFEPPANIDLGDSPSSGVTNLLALLNTSACQHPDRCFVLLGYSQGAQVVGDALVPPSLRICGRRAGELTQAASDRIVAIMLFGDPRFTKGEPFNAGTFDPDREGLYPRPAGALDPYADRLQNFCARDDVTCQGSDGNLQAHVAYFSNDMPAEAATFAVQRIASKRCMA